MICSFLKRICQRNRKRILYKNVRTCKSCCLLWILKLILTMLMQRMHVHMFRLIRRKQMLIELRKVLLMNKLPVFINKMKLLMLLRMMLLELLILQ